MTDIGARLRAEIEKLAGPTDVEADWARFQQVAAQDDGWTKLVAATRRALEGWDDPFAAAHRKILWLHERDPHLPSVCGRCGEKWPCQEVEVLVKAYGVEA